MRSNNIETRIFIFCLMFLFGFLAVGLFATSDDKLPNKIDHRSFLKVKDNFNEAETKQFPAKPPCEKFFNLTEFDDLIKKQDEINRRLIEEIESSQDQKSTRQEPKKLNRKIKSLKEFREELRIEERERRGVQTLLYVEKCVEYNELR